MASNIQGYNINFDSGICSNKIIASLIRLTKELLHVPFHVTLQRIWAREFLHVTLQILFAQIKFLHVPWDSAGFTVDQSTLVLCKYIHILSVDTKYGSADNHIPLEDRFKHENMGTVTL
jgi:hypothetical protein